MRSKRAPDRVHVVRSPEQDDGYRRDGQNIQIIRTLAQISDKLKRSEAERYELLGELREYRKALAALEDKTERSGKAFLSLEHKIQMREKLESEISQRQARFEKNMKEAEEKLVKAAAGQALVSKQLRDNEDSQTAINQRLDRSVVEQTRLARQLDKVSQEKSRMLRKIERLEEVAMETQETLRAKALVLLTDQNAAVQGALPRLPAWQGDPLEAEDGGSLPWWRRSVHMQSVGMAAMIMAALLLGWAINQVQQPEIPQIAVLEGGGLARLNLDNQRWEAVVQGEDDDAAADSLPPPADLSSVNDLEEQKLTARLGDVEPEAGSLPEPVTEVSLQPETLSEGSVQTPAAQEVLDYNDDEILAALSEDPEKLADSLNEIAPAVGAELGLEEKNITLSPPMKDFEKIAFAQKPALQKEIKAEKGNIPLKDRVKADPALEDRVQEIQTQALAGNGEAQHDLAAIYTAGHGGVKQDFEKARFWFREASDNGIANARYNLGVLYHQGLGVDRDLDRALYWYREAARLGHPEAQYNLGIAYIEGIGTDYNPQLAAAFFEKAANSGIVEAAYNLGLIYENGLLAESKPEEALLWYKIAADAGSSDAKEALEGLAKSLQIGMDDVERLVERMQAINKAQTGRRAGPPADKNASKQ